jgi:hypothetical protein
MSFLFLALFVTMVRVATERVSYLAIGGVLFAVGRRWRGRASPTCTTG